MGGAGETVFVHPAPRYEHAADDIAVRTARSADELVAAQRAQAAQVGIECAHLRFAVAQIDAVVVLVQPHFGRFGAEQRRRFGP